MSESNLQAKIRLAAAQDNTLLWRNNVGAAQDDTGRMIRYGLANDSARVLKQVKSADLVGIRRHTIRQEDVGKSVGLFVSVEVKHPGWRMSHSDHEKAQMRWAQLVQQWGGISGFAWDMESARAIWGDV